MNFGTLMGFIAAMAVFVISLVTSVDNTFVVLNFHAALVVIGGTVAVSLICFPLDQIVALVRVFIRRLLKKNKRDYGALIAEVSALSEAHKGGQRVFQTTIDDVEDPFLKEAADVLFWIQPDVSPEAILP